MGTIKIFLGEVNAGDRDSLNSSVEYLALRDMMDYIQDNRDVWEMVTLWSGGDWWPSDYFFNVEPQDTVDDIRLQLGISTFT